MAIVATTPAARHATVRRSSSADGLRWGADAPDPTETCTGTATHRRVPDAGDDRGRTHRGRSVGWIWDIVADQAGSYVASSGDPSTTSIPIPTSRNNGLRRSDGRQRSVRGRRRRWWRRRLRSGLGERREAHSGEAEGRIPRHRKRARDGRRSADPTDGCRLQRDARRRQGEGHPESRSGHGVLPLPHLEGREGEDAQGIGLLQRPAARSSRSGSRPGSASRARRRARRASRPRRRRS